MLEVSMESRRGCAPNRTKRGHLMERTSQDGKVLVYVLIALALIIGGLIVASWATRTPLYTLQAADHPDCLVPAQDRDVLIGLAVSGGGSRAALFPPARWKP